MKNIDTYLKISVLVMTVIVLVAITAGPAAAIPPAAPTPISGVTGAQTGPTDPAVITVANETIAADKRFCASLARYKLLEWQYVLQRTNTVTNPITATVQYSVDKENYVNGPALFTNSSYVTTAQTDLTLLPRIGAQTCVSVDVTTTDPVNLKIQALAQ